MATNLAGDAILKDYSQWTVVEGTLRSATVLAGSPNFGIWWVVNIVFPPLLILPALILLLRGHRANFLYTYVVEGKYYTGKGSRFVRSTRELPTLYGRAVGDVIFVRYNPGIPGDSVVLEQDNPPPVARDAYFPL